MRGKKRWNDKLIYGKHKFAHLYKMHIICKGISKQVISNMKKLNWRKNKKVINIRKGLIIKFEHCFITKRKWNSCTFVWSINKKVISIKVSNWHKREMRSNIGILHSSLLISVRFEILLNNWNSQQHVITAKIFQNRTYSVW